MQTYFLLASLRVDIETLVEKLVLFLFAKVDTK